MSGRDTPAKRMQLQKMAGMWLIGGLAMTVVLAAGCSDYRMSLKEFLALQAQGEAGPDGVPTTQPAAPAPLPAEAQTLINRQLGPYRVGPGDVLAVDIIGPEQTGARMTPGMVVGGQGVSMSLPGAQARVNRDGDIRINQLGKLHVAGMELEDIESMVLDELVKKNIFTDPNLVTVNVGVAAPYMTEILVNGPATTPGLVKLRRCELDVLHALAAAGGITQAASGEVTMKRLRTPGEEVTLNLYKPDDLKEALTMAPLEGGDIVEIRAATPNTIFIGGLVLSPGPQPYPPGTHVTVLQALAGAAGLRTDISPRYATLTRQINGKEVHVKLDLNRIQEAKDPNIVLASGDILWVPFTLETRIEDWLNRNVFFRVGATINANYGVNYSMPGVDYLNRASQQESNLGRSGSTLQDQFDPFGFILQNQTLQTLQGR